MSQMNQLLEQLKKVIKTQKLTYKDIGQKLDLSESTIKRTFTKGSMSLERLEIICEMVSVELSDLIEMSKESQLSIASLSHEQEEELVSNIPLLLVAHMLINKWTVHQILANYDIGRLSMTTHLSRLDKMKLIDYLPNEKVRLKMHRDFHWLDDGPIQQFYRRHVETEFFQCKFTSPGEIKLFRSGMLSVKSNNDMQERIVKLSEHFNALHKDDEKNELSEKFGTSICIAMRPWDISLFSQLRKQGKEKPFSLPISTAS
jgi:DNA-binding Xre family transcriptional regulator